MMLQGEWNAIAKIEHTLPGLAQRLGLTTMLKRTNLPEPQVTLVPYDIHVVGLDNPGIVCEIANFFSSQSINAVNLSTDTYAAPHTGAPMVRLFMTINIPKDIHIADLREQFLLFCDDLNLDAIMEPAKGP
jgi:glycine cleavage system transcriptional repressor